MLKESPFDIIIADYQKYVEKPIKEGNSLLTLNEFIVLNKEKYIHPFAIQMVANSDTTLELEEAINIIEKLMQSTNTESWAEDKVTKGLKYGVGSPGETSNAIITSYLQAKQHSPLDTTNDLFSKVYYYRVLAEQQLVALGIADGNYSIIDIQKLLSMSKGCIATFTFLLMIADSKTFFNNVAVDMELFNITTRIIYDNAKEKASSDIKHDYDVFRSLCRSMHEFLNTKNSSNKSSLDQEEKDNMLKGELKLKYPNFVEALKIVFNSDIQLYSDNNKELCFKLPIKTFGVHKGDGFYSIIDTSSIGNSSYIIQVYRGLDGVEVVTERHYMKNDIDLSINEYHLILDELAKEIITDARFGNSVRVNDEVLISAIRKVL